MSVNNYANNLDSAVRYALETTHAIAVCPFGCMTAKRLSGYG
jgi:hypothetical protein